MRLVFGSDEAAAVAIRDKRSIVVQNQLVQEYGEKELFLLDIFDISCTLESKRSELFDMERTGTTAREMRGLQNEIVDLKGELEDRQYQRVEAGW